MGPHDEIFCAPGKRISDISAGLEFDSPDFFMIRRCVDSIVQMRRVREEASMELDEWEI